MITREIETEVLNAIVQAARNCAMTSDGNDARGFGQAALNFAQALVALDQSTVAGQPTAPPQQAGQNGNGSVTVDARPKRMQVVRDASGLVSQLVPQEAPSA